MDIIIREITTSDSLYQAERELRNEILLRPIGLADFAWESRDKESHHIIALLEKELIGCVLLYVMPDEPSRAQLLQMAVIEGLQGQGVGRRMIQYLLGLATKMGVSEVFCQARDSAINFYQKFDFHPYGERYIVAGIEHQDMKIHLA